MNMPIVIIIALPCIKSAFGRLELPNSRYSSNTHYESSLSWQFNIKILYFVDRASRYFLGKGPNWRTLLFYVFISILYMFRATPRSSSGETILSIQPLVYVTLSRWTFRVQVGKDLSDLHTKRSPTQSDIYQRLHWYNCLSWLWARGCSKHVDNWNKHIEKNFASSWSFTKLIASCEMRPSRRRLQNFLFPRVWRLVVYWEFVNI